MKHDDLPIEIIFLNDFWEVPFYDFRLLIFERKTFFRNIKIAPLDWQTSDIIDINMTLLYSRCVADMSRN